MRRSWAVARWVAATAVAAVLANLALSSLLEGSSDDDQMTASAETIYLEFTGEQRDPLAALERTLATELALDQLDLVTLRAHLIEERLNINVLAAARIVAERAVWLMRLEQGVRFAGALLVVLILGPLLLLLRRPPGHGRPGLVVRSIPYFVATAAATLFLVDIMASSVMGIQRVQTLTGAAGHPAVASLDASIHYLVTTDDAELRRVLDLLFEARSQAFSNPVGALGLVDHLWLGVASLRESALLADAWSVVQASSAVLDGYIVVLILATLLLLVTVVAPAVRRLATYPFDVVNDKADPRLHRFGLAQLGQLWREVRVALWMLFFVLLFMGLVVIANRALCFPIVIVAIKTVLAFELSLEQGAPVADWLLLTNMVSMGLFLVVASALLVMPAGIVLSKANVVVRERVYGRRRFRDNRRFRGLLHGLHWRVVTPAALTVGVLLGACYGVVALVPSPHLRVGLTALLSAPALILVVWRLKLVGRLVRLGRTDTRTAPSQTDA